MYVGIIKLNIHKMPLKKKEGEVTVGIGSFGVKAISIVRMKPGIISGKIIRKDVKANKNIGMNFLNNLIISIEFIQSYLISPVINTISNIAPDVASFTINVSSDKTFFITPITSSSLFLTETSQFL